MLNSATVCALYGWRQAQTGGHVVRQIEPRRRPRAHAVIRAIRRRALDQHTSGTCHVANMAWRHRSIDEGADGPAGDEGLGDRVNGRAVAAKSDAAEQTCHPENVVTLIAVADGHLSSQF